MLERHILPEIKESFALFPAVLLIGGRQIGKSTILQQLHKDGIIKNIYTLDKLSILTAVAQDTEGFLEQIELPAAFDEIQRYPNIMLAIKRMIDEHKRPGMFILTGSANILSYPNVTESLAGRCDIIKMEGLSTSEYLSKPPSGFVQQLFDATETKEICPNFSLDFSKINEGILYGSYPDIRLKASERFGDKWFAAYETAYIERDVRDLNKFLDIVSFNNVFKLLSLQTGNLLNYHHLSVEANLDQRTIKRYIEILTLTFQMTLLHPYSSNGRTTLIKSPKIYMNDVGHASYCQKIGRSALADTGSLLETWVFSELRKAITLQSNIGIYFYRTAKGKEVDFILKKGDQVRAIECKSKTTISAKDLSGLQDFLQNHQTALGVILYKGDQIIPLSSRIVAIPMTCLYG